MIIPRIWLLANFLYYKDIHAGKRKGFAVVAQKQEKDIYKLHFWEIYLVEGKFHTKNTQHVTSKLSSYGLKICHTLKL